MEESGGRVFKDFGMSLRLETKTKYDMYKIDHVTEEDMHPYILHRCGFIQGNSGGIKLYPRRLIGRISSEGPWSIRLMPHTAHAHS